MSVLLVPKIPVDARSVSVTGHHSSFTTLRGPPPLHNVYRAYMNSVPLLVRYPSSSEALVLALSLPDHPSLARWLLSRAAMPVESDDLV